MNLAPLLDAPLPIKIHVATVLPAFLIGTWQLFLSRKGSPLHRAMGYAFIGLMTVTAVDTLFIHNIAPDNPLGLSPVHLFVPLTLFGICSALYGAWAGNIILHRWSMISVYAGALLFAGALAFLPGRTMSTIVFGRGCQSN